MEWLKKTQWAILGSCLVAHFGCAVAEHDEITWEPIAYEELLHQLQHPTGALNDGNYDDVLAQILEEIDPDGNGLDDISWLYFQLETIVGLLNDSKSDEPPPETPVEGGKVKGSRAYGRLNCFGPLMKPTPYGEYGIVLFEGPSFSLEEYVNENMPFEGDTLALFEQCQTGPYTFQGDAPGYLNDFVDHIALDLNLTLTNLNSGSEYLLDYHMLVASGTIAILVVTTEGSYVVGFQPGLDTQFILSAATGTMICSIGLSGWGCAVEI